MMLPAVDDGAPQFPPAQTDGDAFSPFEADAQVALPVDLPTMLRHFEERYIEAALRASSGNKKAAADLLGLQRTTLVEKLRRRRTDGAATPLAATGT
jgi:sigma-54 specific flagellar transcriptional regulator A